MCWHVLVTLVNAPDIPDRAEVSAGSGTGSIALEAIESSGTIEAWAGLSKMIPMKSVDPLYRPSSVGSSPGGLAQPSTR